MSNLLLSNTPATTAPTIAFFWNFASKSENKNKLIARVAHNGTLGIVETTRVRLEEGYVTFTNRNGGEENSDLHATIVAHFKSAL
ncbi:MAG: hypothetical protein ACOYK6_05680 [Chthoniobacterales bacterium]